MTETRSIAVVAERNIFYNAGLAAMLQRDVGFSEVIRAHDYSGLEEILAAACSIEFLALESDLLGAQGMAAISKLREYQPTMRVAVFSERMDQREALSTLAAGAQGFIPKQIGNGSELTQALQTIARNGIFVPFNLLDPHRPRDDEGEVKETLNLRLFAELTEREQQVMRLVLSGHSNKLIARELEISPSTVKVHVHAVFRKLGVHNRVAALTALRFTPPPLQLT
jgi:DNA-binding NarL/FixJ family response regulator